MTTLFLHLLNMSITASWLVLAVLSVRLLFKKAPKALVCALWAVVAIRLLCPFSLESAISLIPSAEPIPQEILYSPSPTIDSGIPAVNEAVNPILSESLAPNPGDSVNPMQVVTAIAANLWILGVIAMLIYAVVSYIRVYRKVRVRLPLEKRVYECDGIDTPFILGIIRPHIYLPSTLSEADRSYVLAHEQAHLTRLDHLWKPLGFALLTVYWFNPLLWVAYMALCRDIELACDERVIRKLDKDNTAAYTEALLHCSTKQRFVTACPLAFGESGVKARIQNALNYKKPAFWIVLLAVIACVAVAVCFLTDPLGRGDAVDSIGAGSELNGLSLSVEELDLTADNPSVTIRWHNDTEHHLLYGESFRLYRIENGERIDTNLVKNSAFHMVGYTLDAHKRVEKTYNLMNYNLSQSGTYRFESSVTIREGDATSYKVWVDFAVGSDGLSPLIAETHTYTIEDTVLSTDKNVHVSYPALASETKDYETLNTFLKNNIEETLYYLQKDYPKSSRIVINYTVTHKDDTLISVLFKGTVTPPEQEAVNIAFTACLAPGNGYTVNPESLFEMDDDFLNTFRQKWLALWDDANLTADKGQEIQSTINGYTNAKLAKLLRDGETADFALTPNGVLVVFRGKPTIADYVLIEIPYVTATTTTTTTKATTTTTTTTVPATTVTTPLIKEINRDRLSEIGMTFAQLKKRHGKMTAMWYHNGGPIAELADGSGKYGFENGFEDLDCGFINGIASLPRGERGELLVDPFPQPKPEAIIRSMMGMKTADIFLGLSENVSGEQLAQMYNVTFRSATPAHMTMDGDNLCSFAFEGLLITIKTESDFIITPESVITRICKAPASTTTTTASKYTLNEDRLSEIGMTFAQLKEKYVETSGATSYGNQISYGFINSKCYYVFNLTEAESLEYSRAPKDVSGSYHPPETMPVPPADRVCTRIRALCVYYLFNNINELVSASGSISPQELADTYGIELVYLRQESSFKEGIAGGNMALFRYGDYEILIRADEHNRIDPDAMIEYIRIAEE